MLNRVLDLYRSRVAGSRLDQYPEMWSAHFHDSELLGEMVGSITEPARVMFWMMMPFGFALEVTESYVLFEAHTAATPEVALIDSDRVLYASRLKVEGRGYRTTHWVIPYEITDRGQRVFGEPSTKPYFVPLVNEALGLILDHRETNPGWSFEEALQAVLNESR
jgi:hypothetical protein